MAKMATKEKGYLLILSALVTLILFYTHILTKCNVNTQAYAGGTPIAPLRTFTEHQESKDNFECSQHDRIAKITESCTNRTRWFDLTDDQLVKTARHMSNVYVDEEHQLLVCAPPKVACTTWLTILCNNSHLGPIPADYNVNKLHYGGNKKYEIHHLRHYNATEMRRILGSFYTFMLVRHPLERIYSAYVNKLLSGADARFQENLGKKILSALQRNLSEEAIATGKGVLFQEFIWYIMKFNYLNEHWSPYQVRCEPCVMQYQRVVKLETYDNDVEDIILEKLAPTSWGFHSKKNRGANSSQSAKTESWLRSYQNLTSEQIDYVIKLYKDDMDMFGFGYRRNNGNNLTSFCRYEDLQCC